MLALNLTVLALAVLQGPGTPPTAPRAPRHVSVNVPAVRVHVDANDDDDSDEGAADGTRDTTLSVSKGTRLSVDNFSGSITVKGWDQDKVRIQTGPDDDHGVDVSGGAVTLRVNGSSGRWGGPEDHDLTVMVPTWMELDLSGNEVNIDVTGVRSSVRAETVEGNVSLQGGDGNISLKSVDGDITIRDAKGRIELNTVEGQVRASGVAGDLDVESVDGEIDLSDVNSQSVTANSVDGSVRFAGPINANGVYHLESHDGDITLETPAAPDAVVSINTFDGDFVSDWPVTVTGATTTRRITFTLGSGKARVELETFDGKISLRRGAGR